MCLYKRKISLSKSIHVHLINMFQCTGYFIIKYSKHHMSDIKKSNHNNMKYFHIVSMTTSLCETHCAPYSPSWFIRSRSQGQHQGQIVYILPCLWNMYEKVSCIFYTCQKRTWLTNKQTKHSVTRWFWIHGHKQRTNNHQVSLTCTQDISPMIKVSFYSKEDNN